MTEALPSVVPYLYYPDATEALEFLVRAFGFEEHSAVRDADGTVWHAQLRVGDGLVMIGPGMAELGTRALPDRAWASGRIHVLVADVDAHHARAAAAGAVIISEPADHVADERIYVAGDCGGQQWIFAQPTGLPSSPGAPPR
jgi:uncharacterized glyoxalase superfamily protein PhnB